MYRAVATPKVLANPSWAPANDPAERQLLLVELDGTVGDYLVDQGFGVHIATQTRDMDLILRLAPIDVVVIHTRGLSDGGLELCRTLYGPEGPAIILVGGPDVTDRILALEMGADDYLTAPFNPRELLARVKAVLRRRSGRGSGSRVERGSRHFLGLRFEFGSSMLWRSNGAPVALTPGECGLLSVFLANPGRVLSRDELLDHARHGATDVFDRVIDVQISRLRQKLAAFTDAQVIRTHRHAGYQFVAEVR